MKSRNRSSGRGRGLLVATIAAVLALTMGVRSGGAAGLLIADGGLGGVLAIEEHSVNVTMNNGIAVTEVTQVFRNTENRQVEALYSFPVPRGATVANFSMWINGKEMVGEVVEKNRAREIYNSYKQQRKDPGLLEQTDFRTFEMRIFPIAAGAQQKVQITYYQEMEVDNDWVTYVYPLASSTTRNANPKVTGKFALSLHATSNVPIVEMTSPSHRDEFVIAKHTKEYAQASLEARGGDLGRDVVLTYRVARPRTGIDVVTSKPKGEDGYFYLTLTAGEELAPRRAGMDYVFVLDISGSMAEDGKLGTSRKSVEAFVDGLAADDRFDLIAFNVAATPLFRELRPASSENRALGVAFLASQQARGGTVLAPAITAAYRYRDPDRPLNVVILSDGLTEQRERAELLSLIQARPSNARVFCIGVGNDVDRPLLEQLAQEAGGLAAFVSRDDNFTRAADAFRRKLMRPAATNVAIAFDGLEVYDLEPKQLPNLYHGMPVRLYGRYRGGGPANVAVRATLDGSEWRQNATIEFPSRDADNPEIERMWAFHRMQNLLKDADRTGSRDRVIDEIVRLGEGYSIVSEYTSFLVLENDGEYQRWKLQRQNALRVDRDRSRQRRLDTELASMRTTAASELGPLTDARPAGTQNQLQQSQPGAPVRASRPASSGGGGGVGALNPISGGLALGVAALEYLRRRQQHGKARQS